MVLRKKRSILEVARVTKFLIAKVKKHANYELVNIHVLETA